MFGKLKEAKEKKEQMGMAADSAKIMANAMSKYTTYIDRCATTMAISRKPTRREERK